VGNPDSRECSACIYFDNEFKECRRRAPGESARGTPDWPQVRPDDWCGEWLRCHRKAGD